MRKLCSILLFFVVASCFSQQIGRYPFSRSTSSASGYDYTDLYGWWSFDEASGDAIDAHGTDDGTVTNAGDAIYGGTGKINDAYDFDRSDVYDVVTLGTGWNPGSGDCSVIAWINQESTGSVTQSICGSTGADGLVFGLSPTGQLHVGSTSNNFSSNTTMTVSTGILTFVAVSYDQTANEATFYMNGSSEMESFSETFTTVTNQIGARDGNDYSFDGIIDEISFWDEALDASTIAYYYNSGNGKGYGE